MERTELFNKGLEFLPNDAISLTRIVNWEKYVDFIFSTYYYFIELDLSSIKKLSITEFLVLSYEAPDIKKQFPFISEAVDVFRK